MNATTLKGDVKEGIGNATGNEALRNEGIADQITGGAKQVVDAARNVISDPAPTVEKAKGFAKARPYATAAAVGVIGLAILNTLRGK